MHVKKYKTFCWLVFLTGMGVLSFFLHPAYSLADLVLVINTTGQPPLNNPAKDGFMDSVAREAVNRIGYRIDIIHQPAERALRNADNGLIDGEMSRIAGIESIYSNLIRVPEKIMDWRFCVFSKKPIDLNKGWNSLAGKSVAFITGWKILETNVPVSASVTKVKNAEQLFNLLQHDRVDYIIYEYWGGKQIIGEMQLLDVKLREPVLASREMFIYLNKKHGEIVPKLSHALAQMKQDGSYRSMENKLLINLFRN